MSLDCPMRIQTEAEKAFTLFHTDGRYRMNYANQLYQGSDAIAMMQCGATEKALRICRAQKMV